MLTGLQEDEGQVLGLSKACMARVACMHDGINDQLC